MGGEHSEPGGSAGGSAWRRGSGQRLHELRWPLPQSVQRGSGQENLAKTGQNAAAVLPRIHPCTCADLLWP